LRACRRNQTILKGASGEPEDKTQACAENLGSEGEKCEWAFYYTSLALAGLWILFWLWMLDGGFSEAQSRGLEHAIRLFMQNPLRQLAFMGIPVLLLHSLGRSIRYALSGE
jgi:hypothetical protein